LLIVGDGPEREALERQAEIHNIAAQVLFTGAVPHDEVPMYIAAMDVAVAPYRAVQDFYFSPLKLYEYLAAGKPVIASNLGQIADAIRHGHNGYLVEPDNVADLSRALGILSEDATLRDTLAAHAPEGATRWSDLADCVTAIATELRRGVAAT
jgi:glycosyltransferase involved in cell wall biosynthesis